MSLDVAFATYLNTLGDAYDEKLPREGATYPALVYTLVLEDHQPPLDGSSYVQIETLYQVTIFAPTKTAARAIARQIESDRSGVVGTLNGVAICNCQVQIAGEANDQDENLKSVIVEVRFFQ